MSKNIEKVLTKHYSFTEKLDLIINYDIKYYTIKKLWSEKN